MKHWSRSPIHTSLLLVPLLLIACDLPGTVEPPGDPEHFDPYGAYPAIVDFAAGPQARVVSISAQFVHSDGTVDLSAEDYHNWITYEFRRPSLAPEDGRPLGVGGNSEAESVTVKVVTPSWRYIEQRGGGVNLEGNFYHKGMESSVSNYGKMYTGDLTEPPRCSTQDLWKAAIEKGAPANAVAMISYDHHGYTFMIKGTAFRFLFAPDCRIEDDIQRHKRRSSEKK